MPLLHVAGGPIQRASLSHGGLEICFFVGPERQVLPRGRYLANMKLTHLAINEIAPSQKGECSAVKIYF